MNLVRLTAQSCSICGRGCPAEYADGQLVDRPCNTRYDDSLYAYCGDCERSGAAKNHHEESRAAR